MQTDWASELPGLKGSRDLSPKHARAAYLAQHSLAAVKAAKLAKAEAELQGDCANRPSPGLDTEASGAQERAAQLAQERAAQLAQAAAAAVQVAKAAMQDAEAIELAETAEISLL